MRCKRRLNTLIVRETANEDGGGRVEAKVSRGAPARVVFADDDDILRELLRALLGFLPHVTVVGEATDG